MIQLTNLEEILKLRTLGIAQGQDRPGVIIFKAGESGVGTTHSTNRTAFAKGFQQSVNAN